MAAGPFIPFCFPTEVDEPPEGEQWTHEIKYDGYRTQFHLGAVPRAFSRNGFDWSQKYSFTLAAANDCIRRDAVLDGEIVALDDAGRPDFKRLPSAIRWHGRDLVFFAFDLLQLDGTDIRTLPCEDRRKRLQHLVGDGRPELRFSDAFDGSGAALFAKVAEMELEGIVSKRRASPYRSGDSRDWLKTKVYAIGEYWIIGYERGSGHAPALLLAEETDKGLRYVGKANPAIGSQRREELWQALEFLKTSAFATAIDKTNKLAVSVQPRLLAKAKHLRGAGKLRHATVVDVLVSRQG